MFGKIIWFFGLPCSGKTTLADHLCHTFDVRDMKNHRLDGDVVRKKFTKDLGFSIEDRFENIRRMGYLADALSQHGINVIASFVTPLRAYRFFLERLLGDRVIFIECGCGIEKCMERDVKGMYEKALFGEIKNFTGLTSLYEKGPGALYDNYYCASTGVLSESDCVIKIKGFLELREVF